MMDLKAFVIPAKHRSVGNDLGVRLGTGQAPPVTRFEIDFRLLS